jgi:hypothetical protein
MESENADLEVREQKRYEWFKQKNNTSVAYRSKFGEIIKFYKDEKNKNFKKNDELNEKITTLKKRSIYENYLLIYLVN